MNRNIRCCLFHHLYIIRLVFRSAPLQEMLLTFVHRPTSETWRLGIVEERCTKIQKLWAVEKLTFPWGTAKPRPMPVPISSSSSSSTTARYCGRSKSNKSIRGKVLHIKGKFRGGARKCGSEQAGEIFLIDWLIKPTTRHDVTQYQVSTFCTNDHY